MPHRSVPVPVPVSFLSPRLLSLSPCVQEPQKGKRSIVEWDKWYDALVAHGKEYGSCNVHRLKQYPLQDGSNRMVKLGEWVRHVMLSRPLSSRTSKPH